MLGRLLDDSYEPEVRDHLTTVTGAKLAASACYRFAAPFLATIARGLDVTLDEIGIAIAVTELVGLASPAMAHVVDRLGRRRAMVLGLTGVVAGAAGAGAARGVVAFTAALVLLNLAKVVFDLGLGSWIAHHVPYAKRSKVVGLSETAWALGLLIGVSTMGLVTAAWGWRAGYLVGAGSVALAAVVIATRVGHDHAARGAGVAPAPHGPMVPGATIAIAGTFSLMFATQCLFVTFGGWLEDSFGFTPAALSAVTFALGLGELAASLTSSYRTDRWGKARSTAAGGALLAACATGLAAVHDHAAPALVLLVIGILGFEFAIVSYLAIASRLVPSSPARGLGLSIGAGTLGRAIASIPATRLYERSGFGAPALMAAAAASVSAVAMLTVHRRGVA